MSIPTLKKPTTEPNYSGFQAWEFANVEFELAAIRMQRIIDGLQKRNAQSVRNREAISAMKTPESETILQWAGRMFNKIPEAYQLPALFVVAFLIVVLVL